MKAKREVSSDVEESESPADDSPTKVFVATTKNDPSTSSGGGLSAFEQQVQKNIEDRMKMFQALNLDSFKQDVKPSLAQSKCQSPKVRRPLKQNIPQPPVRRSRRLQSRPETTLAETQLAMSVEEAEPQHERKLGKLPVSECMSSDEVKHLEDCSNFLSQVSSASAPSGETVPGDGYFDTVCRFEALSDDCWTRLVPKRVTSVAWSPCRQLRFVVAADKTGCLGLWNIDGGVESTHLLQPHQQGIVQVSFPEEGCDTESCFTTSYDGITRRLDLTSLAFEQVFALPDDQLRYYTSSHVHVGGSEMLVGCSDGRVFRVDRRQSSAASSALALGLSGVRTLSLHPSRHHCLLMVEKPRTLSMWDLRHVRAGQRSALLRVELPQSCHGAYIDRAGGDRLVAACMDDTVRLYRGLNAAVPSLVNHCTVKHDNHTGRWLSPLRPVWLPGSESHFIIGSMRQRRRVEVMNDEGRVCHLILGDALQSVLSALACHPTLPLIAGANSSGRVYVFQ